MLTVCQYASLVTEEHWPYILVAQGETSKKIRNERSDRLGQELEIPDVSAPVPGSRMDG